jgi:hypothetical protein
MPAHNPHARRAARRVQLLAEPLESRTLLSGSASSAHGLAAVSIQVPGDYISQQSSALDVTLVRTTGAGHGQAQSPLTVEFSATPGTLRGGTETNTATAGPAFTPVDLSVTFPPGVTTATAVVPINPDAANPGLVPVSLAVTPQVGHGRASTTTVYLASGPAAVPPAITTAHLVVQGKDAVGIAITFSKPMAPAQVANIHNYTIIFKPSQNFTVSDLTGIGLVQQIANQSHKVAFRAARYDPATDTVTLIARQKLSTTTGSYVIKSPASLASRKARATNAQPLTDLDGNAINLGTTSVIGAFSIAIGRGHPYFDSQPIFAQGS